MYKLSKDINSILRIEDKATIPVSMENADYKAYAKWCSLGNIPEPADEPVIAIPQIISRFQAKAVLLAMASALGLSSEQLDALFIEASKVVV